MSSCVGNTCGTGGWNGPLPGDPDNDIHLSAKSAFGGIDITVQYPSTNPFAIAYIILYRGTTNMVEAAVEVTKFTGEEYFDRVEAGIQYFYWIQVVSVNGTVAEKIGPASATAKSTVERTMQEITERIDAGVLAQSLKTDIARITETENALVTEIRNRLAALDALADTIGGVQSELNQALTFISNEVTERVEGDSALVSAINALGAGAANNVALISTEREVRASADAALGSRIDTVRAEFGTTVGAAVQEEARVRVAADQALATQITQTESALNGNVAQVQQSLSTNINQVNGRLQEIGALYTVKLNANGLAGGFGVYNDGSVVQAGWDVDEFFVGRTNANKIKPFIISGDMVYINSAAIANLEVEKLTSGNVNAEWRLRGLNGRIVMDNGTVMKVMGTGFGLNRDLIEWFGPSMPIGSCTKQNAKIYVGTDGSAYYGGSLSAGILSNAKQSTQTAADAYVELGPFRSNGNPRLIVVSYGFGIFMQSAGLGNDRYIYDGGETWADIQLFREGTLIAGQRFTGSYVIANEIDGPDTADISIGGSFTFTDTGPARDYTYTARIVGRSAAQIRHSSGSSSANNVSQTLSIISSEQ